MAMRPLRALLAGIGIVALAMACSTPTPTIPAADSMAPAPSWPKPPDRPRIRYLRSVHSAEEWGVESSMFRRLVEKLAGAGPESLIRPTGVAATGRTLYVADPGANCLWIFDADRQRSLRVTAAGGDTLVSPVAVAARADGAVFLADSALRKIFLFRRDGGLIQTFAAERLVRPAGLAYDEARETLYVVDSGSNLVVAFGAQGQVVATWGGSGGADGLFNRPTHIALGPAGILLVTDALNFRVQAFDGVGHYLWKFGRQGDASGDFAAPKGLGMDSTGHIYVVDALFDAVQIFSREGSLLLAWGERGIQAGQFSLPNGMFVDAQDRVYVADAYNGRIQVFAAVPVPEGTSK